MKSGGGLEALVYSYRKARESGGVVRFWRRMRTRNACKTCAVGMSGMKNEAGSGPEPCKKSFQPQAADMHPPIPDEFFRRHALADLLRFDHKDLEDAGRIGFPLPLEPDRATPCTRISWEQALHIAAEALRSTPPREALVYASGRSSNEAAFLWQLFVRQLGTNNLPDCSNLCHESSSTALKEAIGVGKGTVSLADFDQADAIFVIGQNPGKVYPSLHRYQ